MAIFQRTLAATAAAATVFAALALPVAAQAPATAAAPATTTPPTAAGPTARQAPRHAHDKAHAHHQRAHQTHGKHLAQKTEKIKTALQLTEAQQASWTSYQETVRSAPHTPQLDREGFAKLTTPERLDRMRELRTERHAQTDRRAEATKAFYATLTPEQQKIFDAQTLRRGKHHGGHHHGKFHAPEKADAPHTPAPASAAK